MAVRGSRHGWRARVSRRCLRGERSVQAAEEQRSGSRENRA
jgi:hypothetical protein